MSEDLQYSEVCIGYSVGLDSGGTMYSGSYTLMQELCPGLPGFLEWASGVFFIFIFTEGGDGGYGYVSLLLLDMWSQYQIYLTIGATAPM